MNATFREEHQQPGSFNLSAAAEFLRGLDETGWLTISEEACATRPVDFVFRWEEEFARILDAHEVSWQYKPRTFAVEWDAEGNFVDSFTPDFYLPGRDVYVELIDPDYKASAAKARKVRLLTQLHPEINIKLVSSSRSTSTAKTPGMKDHPNLGALAVDYKLPPELLPTSLRAPDRSPRLSLR